MSETEIPPSVFYVHRRLILLEDVQPLPAVDLPSGVILAYQIHVGLRKTWKIRHPPYSIQTADDTDRVSTYERRI